MHWLVVSSVSVNCDTNLVDNVDVKRLSSFRYIVTELSEENKDHISTFMNQLNGEIEKMRNSSDINAKKGAILAIGITSESVLLYKLLFVYYTLLILCTILVRERC